MENMKNYLIQKRVLKSNLTKLKEKIECYKEDAEFAEVSVFRDKLKTMALRISDVFDKIFELCEESDIDKYILESEDMQEVIDNLNIIIIRVGEKFNGDKIVINCAKNTANEFTEVQLPKLSIPTFSGNLEEWLSFCDLFEASIKNNSRLSNAQKLQYLKSSLKGNALKLVQSLSITDANFQIAWELLTERFSNRRELIFSLIKRIMTLPTLHNENPTHILHIVDSTKECIRSLESLGETIEHFAEAILVFVIQNKLDPVTRSWWERSLKNDDIPTLGQLLDFLTAHARTIQNSKVFQSRSKGLSTVTSLATSRSHQLCLFCEGEHFISICPKYCKLPVQKRVDFVKENKLCFNCLKQKHRATLCKSIHKCKMCKKPHHTLLHFERVLINDGSSADCKASCDISQTSLKEVKEFPPKQYSSSNSVGRIVRGVEEVEINLNSSKEMNFEPEISSCLTDFQLNNQVLLCTAIIKVRDFSGEFQLCRALLDPGSQASFITENCINKLGLSRKRARVQVSCLGSTGAHTNGITEITFKPHFASKPMHATSVFVMNKIIGDLPHYSIDPKLMECFKDITLADYLFYKSGPIDILLGVSVSLPMLRGETINKGEGFPIAVRSDLGWIISGAVNCSREASPIMVNNINLDTDQLVKKFWELEAVPLANLLTREEQACEEHFERTHHRDDTGRYSVRLPFKSSSNKLGDSRQLATRRFKQLENKLITRPAVCEQYKEFMKEYEQLGHMERIPTSEKQKDPSVMFYLPHHAVVKESSTTTKLRVVFDASAKSSSGVSLNDILMVGPRIQNELFPILLRFRTFPVAICADVAKMFRQIQVHSDDREFQRILWRDSPDKPITEFRLMTVTYGTACAPFISTRTLKQLALDEEKEFPLASKATRRDFYVDDLLSGAQTVEEACDLTEQLIKMMESGGFTLRKWSSNISSVLEIVPEEFRAINVPLKIDSDHAIKVLGINWHPCSDIFEFSVSTRDSTDNVTKRSILSEVAKIFDPMGWLAPTVVFAKIFLQELWTYELSWDEPINETLNRKWRVFQDELSIISNLKIPRYALMPKAVLQLHAFCDSSEKAYCAVVYVRSRSLGSSIKVMLLAAKTRVAPLKNQSLPRLELCSALLLSNLLEAVAKYLEIPSQDCFAWSDSTVALCWIKSEPRRWQTFVANRVARIQEAIPNIPWSHVQGNDNPADCATRGLLPSELMNCDIWFNGPKWLREPDIFSTKQNAEINNDEVLKEERKHIVTTVTQTEEDPILTKYSSWTRLCRIIAWCLRFVRNCSKDLSNRLKSFLSRDEINEATATVTKLVQESHFSEELQRLTSNKPLKSSSRILSLSPFLDKNGVIRVGGRLGNAQISEDQKHPVLLPKNHYVTELISRHFHENHLHAGPQLLLSAIRQKFWILSGRDVVKKLIRQCTVCCRQRAKTATQFMADLPAKRVQQSRAFSCVGIDYAGPFHIKPRKGRGIQTIKIYVCIFVCFTTRAIHLEVVCDLSTKAFLATLKRFVARRGKPVEIHSDCGTNFVGAERELKKAIYLLHKNEQVHGFFTSENIKWSFNPPSAPHFGGLWEAGVKSMKFHLKRTLGTSFLTFEEFLTLIAQVEACLNSRPLCALSNDPSDYAVLTPGHFLIGTPLTAIPETNFIPANMSHLDRWEMAQKILHHFWNRWSKEFLSRLQQRPKWCQVQRNFELGNLVLLKEENLPPCRWRMGRIIKIYPGKDGKVRVVDVATTSGELKRSITKLCALPFEGASSN